MDKEAFKQMFSEYCRAQAGAGNCDDGECAFCCVNAAWERIFGSEEESDEEEEAQARLV